MVNILNPMLMGPAQGLRQPPAMPAAVSAPSRFAALGDRAKSLLAPEVAWPMAAGMFMGRTPSESLGNAFMFGGQAMGEQKMKEEEQRQQNATLAYLQKSRPDLAAAVSAGMPMQMAWQHAFNKGSDLTDDMREYQMAADQGFGGSFMDYMTTMKKAGATQISNTIGGTDKFRERIDQNMGDMFSELATTGYKAQTSRVQIDRLDTLLSQIPQGTGGGAAIKQVAGNFGIPTEGVSEIQAAQAIINQLVPQQRPAGSGPMSDADLELFKQSLPRIINQPGGNQLIIETMRGIAEYSAAQGEIAQAVMNGQITPQQGMQELNRLPDPLASFKTSSVGTGGGINYKERYGLE